MTIHAPVQDFDRARESMVDSQLRPQGVSFPPVVEALASVRREQFVAEDARMLAYVDRSVPIGDGRSMSSATVLGLLLTELAPRAGERALVVGCGTGYSAVILGEIGVRVVAVESSKVLAARARDNGVEVVEGPLEQGWKKGAPYNLILVDGAIEVIPDAIIAQLTPQGRLGTALLDRGIARLVVGHRAGDGFGIHTMADAGAASLPGFTKPRTFSF